MRYSFKLLMMFVGLIVSHSVFAEGLDVNVAASKASSFLKKGVNVVSLPSEVKGRMAVSGKAEPAFHIFNAEDGKGFVIISGDDNMPEIVAYSHSNSFNAANMHPSLVGMLQCYTEVVDDVRQGGSSASLTKTRSIRADLKDAVAPLVEVHWGQDEPYDALCPEINGEKCPVGCVATAMAQIMHHHKWPARGKGSLTYATGISGWSPLKSVFSDHEYHWDVMQNETSANIASAEASKEVAQISFDCGVATKMDYSLYGSGTYDDLAMLALYSYFGYKASTVHLERRDCYSTQEEWNDLVKSELCASRPVLYAGHSANNGGHEFVIDGYDENGMFHVNWGWDGMSNGYYSIVTLAPKKTNSKYDEGQSMICGIEPDFEGTDQTPHQFRIYMKGPSTTKVESIKLNDLMTVTTGPFYNRSRSAHTWTVAIALYSEDGQQISVISKPLDKYKNLLMANYGTSNGLDVNCRIPADTPNGKYYLRTVFCQEGYDEYLLPDMEGGSELNAIGFLVRDGYAYFDEETPVSSVAASAPRVLNTEYFSLDGRRLSSPKGISVVRKTFSDGSININKVSY